MKRLPLLPSLIVGVACAVMIALGIWQLQRANEKALLLDQYRAAAALPVMAYPLVPDPENLPLFRRAATQCLSPAAWRAKAGRNLAGETGWVHIAQCRTGAEGPGAAVEVGWSRTPASPTWAGGPVEGVITTDNVSVIRLVSAMPLADGMMPSARPSMETVPNNHLSYAVQWFAFAAIALGIYAFALRRNSATKN